MTAQVFGHPEYDGHEAVLYGYDEATGLRALVAVHSTRRGPALGGCRMYPYADEAAALTDALRLSRGMSFKTALADLPLGGGKSVIIGDPRAHKPADMMQAMGRLVHSLSGRYIAAEDVGIGVSDVQEMAKMTPYVSGIGPRAGAHGDDGGDPSPATALGVWLSMQRCVERIWARDDLRGLGVAIQGVGKVGASLARHVKAAGGRLWICDAYTPAAQACAEETGAEIVPPEAIFDVPADIFAPCALGACLTPDTIGRLRARLVVGAANNQLASAAEDDLLDRAGIVYAPDYVVNAGGIIDVYYQSLPVYDEAEVRAHIHRIPDTLEDILERAVVEGLPTGQVAESLARERLGAGGQGTVVSPCHATRVDRPTAAATAA